MKLNVYITTYAPSASGEMEVDTEKVLMQSTTYNQDGKEVCRETFDENINAFGKEVYEYNENGQLAVEELFDHEQQLVQKIEYQYNDLGKITTITEQFEDAEEKYITRNKYDGEHLVQIDHYYDNDFDFTEKKYQYEKNLLIKEIEYDEYNEVKNIIIFKYNDKGVLIKTIRDEVKEKDRRTYEFFYNDQNNKVKELIYNYKDKLIAAQYTKFNDQKQEVEIEWEDLDNYRKTVQEYNGDQLVKVGNLNREGAVTNRSEFQYDDQKNLILLKRYELETVYTKELQLTQETFYERVS